MTVNSSISCNSKLIIHTGQYYVPACNLIVSVTSDHHYSWIQIFKVIKFIDYFLLHLHANYTSAQTMTTKACHGSAMHDSVKHTHVAISFSFWVVEELHKSKHVMEIFV